MCYCVVDRPEGRSTLPIAFTGIAAAIVALLAWTGNAFTRPTSPAWIANEGAMPAEVRVVKGVRHVISGLAPVRLLPDSAPPTERVRLMWLDGRAAQPSGRGGLVLDREGGILDVDARLRVRRREPRLDGREVASVAPSSGGGLWVTTLDGEVLLVSASGEVQRTLSGNPLGTVNISAGTGNQAWLVRSTARFAYHLDSAASLLARIDADLGMVGVGAVRVPEHSLLIDLANAGSLAVQGDVVFYAPFIRDEIVAMKPSGDTLWVASRRLPQTTVDPRFELDNGKPVVNYHPVNLGMAIGLDGNLYVLSTPDYTTTESRLDVFDPMTGWLLRSARFPTALPTLAVAASGRVYLLDADSLLADISRPSAEQVRVVPLPLLSGGTGSIAESGRLTLVNVWASWCGPCRDEMPALDSLQHELRAETRFRFVTVNEDVRVESAQAFLTEFGFTFPVLLGRGRAKDQLHYPGLPYTLLLDDGGRVVRKWIGYEGPSQVSRIREAIGRELQRTAATSAHVHH